MNILDRINTIYIYLYKTMERAEILKSERGKRKQ